VHHGHLRRTLWQPEATLGDPFDKLLYLEDWDSNQQEDRAKRQCYGQEFQYHPFPSKPPTPHYGNI